MIGAHRAALIAVGVPIPKSHKAMHSCDNPPCINPEHLSPGTHAENMADMVRKGRSIGRKGADHHKAKLTDAIVSEILETYSDRRTSTAEIAQKYGVSQPTISYILIGKTWKHIPRNF